MNNNTNNLNMASLMQMLSKMDKKDLEAGIAKANQILQSRNKNDIIKEINKEINKWYVIYMRRFYERGFVFFFWKV